MLLALLVTSIGAGPACGDTTTLVDPDRLVAIAHGAYGLTTKENDVGDTRVLPLGDFRVLVYDHVPARAPTGEATENPLAETRSDEQGFYQLSLAAGRYVFCASFLRCEWLDVPPGQRIRLDYRLGVGPGWSQGEAVSW